MIHLLYHKGMRGLLYEGKKQLESALVEMHSMASETHWTTLGGLMAEGGSWRKERTPTKHRRRSERSSTVEHQWTIIDKLVGATEFYKV